ncbi:hypothetical protein [Alysiella crassa]|uniref:PepSY domain-containing protein n=1 Tax=Alysiella crassa TaxID=153491 RepID=A0A376BV68_9NEIS|nr:hypothetical protein [Alysiella crassa]UOP06387.1 hypothetical protein LVJ80_11460 [Alysiella crassa]SSY80902.1 Uncharacterised protein [Alysiella crassa]
MKTIKTAIFAVVLGISFTAQATSMPSEIFKPRGAQTIKSQAQGNGEYEAEFRVQKSKNSVPALAKQAIRHAQSKGFRVVEQEIDREDADLKFRRGNHELSISIEDKDNGWIEIDQDLDIERR